MPNHRKRALCLHCSREKLVQGRGLCRPCWLRHRDDYPVKVVLRNWTAKEVAWLRENYQALGLQACALALGRSPGAVSMQAHYQGVAMYRQTTAEEELRLRELHAAGLWDRQVAEQMGTAWTASRVKTVRHRLGLAANRGVGGTHEEGLLNARRTCRANDVRSLVDLRYDRENDECAARGQPLARTHREADVLDLLRRQPGLHAGLVAAHLFDAVTPSRLSCTRKVLRRLVERQLLDKQRVTTSTGAVVCYRLAPPRSED